MRIIILLLLTLVSTYTHAQVRGLDFILIDEDTARPIVDAHAFINSATYGAVSDKQGRCEISLPSDVTEELIISHVSYELKIIKFSAFNIFAKGDTIYLSPNGFDLDAVVIKGDRVKGWKKNYRKFYKAFIGKGKRASLCEIKNPEVLRFSNEDGVFKVTAIDMLKIRNHYLGYDIDFLLRELTIDKDGSMKYFGYPKFTDKKLTATEEELEKNRKEAYTKSINHFLLALISDSLAVSKYKIELARYTGTEFIKEGVPKAKDIVQLDTASGLYHVLYDDFLKIEHLGIKRVNDSGLGVAVSGEESRKFGSNQPSSYARVTNATSLLYKKSPSLIVNKYGNVMNQRQMQEYGYFAEKRIADLLPFNYGFKTETGVSASSNQTKSIDNATPLLQLDTTSLTITSNLLYGNKEIRDKTLDYIENNWREAYIPILLDINKMITSEDLNPRIIHLLIDKAQIFDYFGGLQWMWEDEPVYDKYYADAKGEIFQHIDPLFKLYFQGQQETATVSIDEIVWGGVKSEGIPGLRLPKMLSADQANYLDKDDIVFGFYINGEAKAYPKRVLAWHEFFIDKIGGENIAGVYCTLCGTMIGYDMYHRGKLHDLATSGFLYRSNKLMYDKQTKSLWSTIDGTPVLGTLANKGIKLKTYPVVTTTWGDWQSLHPDTKVLDVDTGYDRDYSEGRAYRSYFSHDNLMFPVPLQDNRLDNKAEVLIIRSSRYETDPLAISIKYLKKKRLHQDIVADKNIVVLANKNGSARVYYTKNVDFKSYKRDKLKDNKDNVWTVTEAALISPKGRKLLRAPSHNAFWFAWFNMYPKTRLVK